MQLRELALVTAVCLAAAASTPAAETKPAAAPVAAAAKPSPASTITGKVSGADGKPVAGAIVRAIPMAPRAQGGFLRGGARPDVPKAVVAKTDAAGAFKLEGLGAGPHALRAEAAGLAPAYAADVPVGASLNLRLKAGLPVVGRVLDLLSQKPIAGATVTAIERDAARFGRDAAHVATTADNGTFKVADCAPGVVTLEAIAPAKARAQLDHVVVKTAPPGEEPSFDANTIFLQPGGRIAGRAVGADGKPLSDVIVTAIASDGNLMSMLREGRLAQRTDVNGRFSFDGIPAGNKYTLRATKDGFAADEDGPIAVEAGTDRGDVELKLDGGASLAFRLLTADDLPVKDVDIRLQPQGGGRRRGGAFSGAASEVDNSKIVPQGDGKFLVKALEPGTFDLTLAPPEFADVTKEGLKLKNGETVDLGTLRVKESKSISGNVTDSNGQPVAGASISALWFDGTIGHSREVKSGAAGHYKLAGLSDQPVSNLWVRAEGYAEASREGAAPGDNAVDFVLARTGSIVGRVVLMGGGIPAAYRAQTFPEAKEGQERAGMIRIVRNRAEQDKIFSDPTGNFRLDNVDPGNVTLTVLSEGRAPARKAGLMIVSEQVLDVGTLTLDDGKTLRGRVVAAKDDAPIAGATVTLSQPQGFGRMMGNELPAGAAITSLDGHFEIPGLEVRTYAINAGQPEYSPNSGRVEIPSDGDPEEFVIHLSKGGTVTGLVRDAAKQPIPNASVLLLNPGRGEGPQTASAGVDGRYTFEKITPGEYTIIRAPTGGGPLMLFGGMKQVAVREGETTVYDLDEASKINLTGRVLKGGQPVPNAILFFTTPNPDGEAADLRQSRTDADGRYQIGLDKAGSYAVVVSAGGGGFMGGGRSATPVEVPDQPNPVVDIPLKAAAITGQVVNAEGKAVSGAVVSAAEAGSGGGSHGGSQDRTDPDGSFSIGGVSPGTYKLVVVASGYRNAEVPSVVVRDENDSPSVEVRLESGRTARGRVVDASGAGIAGAMVMAAPSGTLPSGRDALPATTDVNGGFVLTVPADGPIDVTAVAAGFPPARANGIVPLDGSDIALRAPRGAQLRVTVLSAEGKPAAGARVVCRPVPAYLGSDYLTFLNSVPPSGTDGVAVVGSLAPGSYELVVSLDAKRTTRAVIVAEGAAGAETVLLP
jgi:uncharacterized GH25 family protein